MVISGVIVDQMGKKIKLSCAINNLSDFGNYWFRDLLHKNKLQKKEQCLG